MLTEAETREFTAYNLVTFDLMMVEAKAAGTIPPCWLTLSDEAKQAAKEKVAKRMSAALGVIVPLSVERAEEIANNPNGFAGTVVDKVVAWKETETEYKARREAGDPLAFFAK